MSKQSDAKEKANAYQAKSGTNQSIHNNFSMQYGVSKDYFGHKDYYAAKAGGASDKDILKQLNSNPDQLRGGNVKGGGGLYDQIKKGFVPGWHDKQGNNNGNKTTNNTTDISNSQDQNVNQDNDITNTIDGNNNNIVNNVDNSNRQYGGDNRSFVYNGSGDLGKDNVATMATLAGIWDVNDSHGAQAARLDRNITMNRDAQKKYANTQGIAQSAITRARQNSYIDPAKLDARIRARTQNSYDRSTLIGKDIFGDLGNMNFNWQGNKDEEKVEQPDFNKMYKDYSDF